MEKIIYDKIKFYKIKDYKYYYISKCGKVLSTKKYRGTNRNILKYDIQNNGYKYVYFENKHFLIHRLVAKAFLENKENKSFVNHKDCNKLNNNIINLEWCTKSENQRHAHINNLNVIKKSKKIKQLDLNGNLIKIWNSTMDIRRNYNINGSSISQVCMKKKGRKTYLGFKWEYYD